MFSPRFLEGYIPMFSWLSANDRDIRSLFDDSDPGYNYGLCSPLTTYPNILHYPHSYPMINLSSP